MAHQVLVPRVALEFPPYFQGEEGSGGTTPLGGVGWGRVEWVGSSGSFTDW